MGKRVIVHFEGIWIGEGLIWKGNFPKIGQLFKEVGNFWIHLGVIVGWLFGPLFAGVKGIGGNWPLFFKSFLPRGG